MKSNYLKTFLSLVALVLLANVTISAQDAKVRTSTKVEASKSLKVKPTTISKTDQASIKELFAGVDENLYILKFDGKVVAGKKKVDMANLRQTGKIKVNPGGEAGYFVLTVENGSFGFFLAVAKGELEKALGKEKTIKLNAIMSKYQ